MRRRLIPLVALTLVLALSLGGFAASAAETTKEGNVTITFHGELPDPTPDPNPNPTPNPGTDTGGGTGGGGGGGDGSGYYGPDADSTNWNRTNIGDSATPLARAPGDTVTILDPDVPLASLGALPKTGGNWLFILLLLLAGGACLTLDRWKNRKKHCNAGIPA